MAVSPNPSGGDGGFFAGVMKKSIAGRSGFITQDNGQPDLFVLPTECGAFGNSLPPVGTPVWYTLGTDRMKGLPKAENVQPVPPADDFDTEIAKVMREAAREEEPETVLGFAGTMKSASPTGKFGFIKSDDWEDDLFVMPSACPGFLNALPPVGARVAFTVSVDKQKGQPMADNVQPLDESLVQGAVAAVSGAPSHGMFLTGIVKQKADKYGFILQDNGEKDMFFMPTQCEAFGGVCPPVGTRVMYSVVLDPKTERLRAEAVQPEKEGESIPSAVPVATDGWLSGTMKHGSTGKWGFIEQDSGEKDMFVMPAQCEGFGGSLPSGGARVAYTVIVDPKTGRPRAETVHPCESFGGPQVVPPKEGVRLKSSVPPGAIASPASREVKVINPPEPGPTGFGGFHVPSPEVVDIAPFCRGVIKKTSGKSGFIMQESGEPDLFVLPSECVGFGKMIPDVGTVVTYTVGPDREKGLPMAYSVQPETSHDGASDSSDVATFAGRMPFYRGPGDGGTSAASSGGGGGGGTSESDVAMSEDDRTFTGTMKQNTGKWGFIAQDNGERDMFLMPGQCEAFGGVIPPEGTRVRYTICQDAKTGRPRADKLEPEHGPPPVPVPPQPRQNNGSSGTSSGCEGGGCGYAGMQQMQQMHMQMQMQQQQYQQALAFHSPPQQPWDDGLRTGVFKQNSGKWGFIQQDCGETDMFVMPFQCEAFGNEFPPIGARVAYFVGIDPKTGRPRAEAVCPESMAAYSGGFGKGGKPFCGKGMQGMVIPPSYGKCGAGLRPAKSSGRVSPYSFQSQ
eukprot:TRINITY_DN67512_c0_g1_i1.p1 TRINITY_DN67512_c0_g1~~TRINITY_DN67512_c0_g1_i1.p1  ORF type:complete len:790 (+),score=121.76 TRINITY_DN67512_c0_g1_i1:49-2418(+)